MIIASSEKNSYKTFIKDFGGHCWRCDREASDRPTWWGAPYFGPERAHIDGCNHPRIESRKCCLILCSLCHRIQHGDRFTYDLTDRGRFPLCTQTPLTIEESLRLKFVRDPDYFDLKMLQKCSIRRLPQVTFKNYFDNQITQSSGVPGEAAAKDRREGDEPGWQEDSRP